MNRLDKITALLKSISVDGLILTNHDGCWEDVYYTLGIDDSSPLYLWIDENEAVLFRHETKAFECKDLKVIHVPRGENVVVLLKKQSGIRKARKIGINFKVPASFLKALEKDLSSTKFVDVSEELARMRSVKEHSEIKMIKTACKITDDLFEELVENRFWKTSSKKVMWLIKELAVKNELDMAFQPIVNFDTSTAFVHHGRHKARMKRIALLDIGVRWKRYCSDSTRVFLRSGSGLTKICIRLQEVMDRIKREVHAGKKVSDVCILAEEIVSELFEKEECYFNFHSLGHGIGLNVHEYPFLRKDTDIVLEKNMIITLEPAVYSKNYGVRMEGVFLIENKKLKELTKYEYFKEI